MAIDSRERIKYIHVIKLGSLQNKRQNQQQAPLGDIVAKKKPSKNNERKQQWNSVSMKQKDKRY
ncbi:hypothetical protein C2R69_03580 [Helicobacter pylori]|nr:hypothetical protein [Helicobacter pylori]PUD73117.1 hypothetical protein C2R69_03580 [Helicobacter pylori]